MRARISFDRDAEEQGDFDGIGKDPQATDVLRLSLSKPGLWQVMKKIAQGIGKARNPSSNASDPHLRRIVVPNAQAQVLHCCTTAALLDESCLLKRDAIPTSFNYGVF